MSEEYKVLKLEVKDKIAQVILSRPEKRNSMGPDFWPDFTRVFKEIDKDPEIYVVVVSGEGKSFCAGLDLKATGLMVPKDKGPAGTFELFTLHHHIMELQESLTVIEECRKPVIAAVHGACIGGGLDLISCCDIRLCSEDAYYSLREARMGMCADLGIVQRLPHIIGQGHSRELAYTAKDIDAKRAEQIGLVNHVYPDREACIAAALEMAEEIKNCAPLGVQTSKEVFNYCRDKSIRDGLDYVCARNSQILRSADIIEAFMAFAQKRKPKFKGN